MNYSLGQGLTGKSPTILLAEKLGEGGEGSVWSLVGRPEVAKIYSPRLATPEREQKLVAMIANPPQDDMLARFHHVSIAWPRAMVYQEGKFSGFLMPRLAESYKILDIYNPRTRRSSCPGFNWKYLLHTALNLSIAMNALHVKGYIIGDINEGNILVNRQALVSLIDTDSFQVQELGGQVFRCPVGKEEFTPPELQGVQFNQVNRLPQHDYFGLAVMIFLLLMEGNHPYSGILKVPNPSADPDNIYCLKAGKFPYSSNPVSGPRPTAPRFEILPPEVRRLLERCFVDGYTRPANRPSPAEWIQTLENAEKNLVHCRVDPNHWYGRHLRQCPWCTTARPRLQTPLPAAKTGSLQLFSLFPVQIPGHKKQVGAAPSSNASVAPVAGAAANLASGVSPLKPQPGLKPKSKASFQPISPTHPRERLVRWLGSSGYKPKFTPRFWWKNVQVNTAFGLVSGLALAGVILAMFTNPAPTGTILGSLASLVILSLGVWITFFRFKGPGAAKAVLAWGVKTIGLILTVALSVILWPIANTLAANFLALRQPQPGWLLLDGIVLGSGLGASFGTFRLFAHYRNLIIAVALALTLAILPFLVLFAVGAFGFTFT